MQPQINYRCDVCEDKFILEFKKPDMENKIECPHCHVEYEFSKEDLTKLSASYQDYLNTLENEGEEKIS